MEKILYLRERKREFNRTFECLSDDANRWSDEQSKRYKSEWEKQIRENPNYEGEPIDFFFPLLSNGCLKPLIKICDAKRIGRTIYKSRIVGNCIKSYHRILIQKNKNENNTNKSIS